MKIQRRYRNLLQLRKLVEDDRYFTDIEEEEDGGTQLQRIPETGTTLYLLGAWFQMHGGTFSTFSVQKEDLNGNVLLNLQSIQGRRDKRSLFSFPPTKILGGLERVSLVQSGGTEATSLWWGWIENTIKPS